MSAEVFGATASAATSCLLHLLSVIQHDDHVLHGLEVAAVTAPAIAAFLTLSSNLRAYEAHTRSYQQMGAIYRRAERVEQIIAFYPRGADRFAAADEFRKVMRDVGREALAETAEWLMDHRDRRVEPS